MTALLQEIRESLPGLRASTDEGDRVAYSRDLWPRHHLAVRAGHPANHEPGAIVWPASTEQVSEVVRWARGRGVALVPFGGGSGVCAGVLPRDDLVVVDLKRMRRIRRIDRDAPAVDVEAGIFGVPLETALGEAGFTLGHFPSSILCSTVGGWIAARSAGQCSGRYGKIEDMVLSIECVTGAGEVVRLRRRTSSPDLVPLVIGSEGTLAIVTSAELRLHPAPAARGFAAYSFPTVAHGLRAVRELFQQGLRPAVARLYDPLDAFLARRARTPPAGTRRRSAPSGARGSFSRALLRRPRVANEWIHSAWMGRALGGALLVLVFEGQDEACQTDVARCRRLAEEVGGGWLGEGPARRWFSRRYAVSYRQAPLFADGLFVDTMEVAAPWSRLAGTYDAVRRGLGRDVLVTAHFSHAYPDGCCIYFTFAGTAAPELAAEAGWDAACEATYDRAWRSALEAAGAAGATLAHHHGIGRSKAPRLAEELGSGVEVVRSLLHAFDPSGVLNPGNLVPAHLPSPCDSSPRPEPLAVPVEIDAESELARISGAADLGDVEQALNLRGYTLGVPLPSGRLPVGEWLAAGAPGTRDPWLDPVDHLVAGFEVTLRNGRHLAIRPAPRRSVGPDLTALFVGATNRFGRIDSAWLRIHRHGVDRPSSAPFAWERDPVANDGERALLDAIERRLLA